MDEPERTEHPPDGCSMSRRNFLATGASSAAVPLTGLAGAAAEPAPAPPRNPRDPVVLSLRINRRVHRLAVDVRTSLLDALRDHAGLTGTKKGCDHGQCGACTVLVDDKRVLPA